MNTDRCRSCGAPILWVRAERGKMMPLDAEPNPAGNIILIDGIAHVRESDLFAITTQERWMPHWSYCPQATQWRKHHEQSEAPLFERENER